MKFWHNFKELLGQLDKEPYARPRARRDHEDALRIVARGEKQDGPL